MHVMLSCYIQNDFLSIYEYVGFVLLTEFTWNYVNNELKVVDVPQQLQLVRHDRQRGLLVW